MLEQPEVQIEEMTIEEPLRESVFSLSLEARYTSELQRVTAELEQYKAHAETVKREIERVSKEFDTVSAEIVILVDDSSVGLGTLMRKRGEAADLRSYLAGLRFLSPPNSKSRSAAS